MLSNRRAVKIEWGDCEPHGIVFFPRYLAYFDACTMALFEAAGLPKRQMLRDHGLAGIPMVDLRTRFLIPSYYGDVVEIESEITEWRNSSFEVRHRLFRGDDLAVEGFETRIWAISDPDDPDRMKGERIPDEIRSRFEDSS